MPQITRRERVLDSLAVNVTLSGWLAAI